jgi:hypothetical protein
MAANASPARTLLCQPRRSRSVGGSLIPFTPFFFPTFFGPASGRKTAQLLCRSESSSRGGGDHGFRRETPVPQHRYSVRVAFRQDPLFVGTAHSGCHRRERTAPKSVMPPLALSASSKHRIDNHVARLRGTDIWSPAASLWGRPASCLLEVYYFSFGASEATIFSKRGSSRRLSQSGCKRNQP